MTEKERGDFDALILALNANINGVALAPDTEAWIRERLRLRADDASIRVRARLRREELILS